MYNFLTPSEDEPRRANRVVVRFNQDEVLDFAILELHQPIDRVPLPISLSKTVEGSFILCGYGSKVIKNGQFSGQGEFSGPVYRKYSTKTHLFGLHNLNFGKEGNSGGAIFSLQKDAVVGIMIEASKTNLGPEAGIVLALPLYRIAQLWEPLYKLASDRPKWPSNKIQNSVFEEIPAPSEILHGQFYIERTADTHFRRQIFKKGGTLTTICAARQSGKTSLLVQGVNHARQNGMNAVYLDLQRLESTFLQPYDCFLRYLAEFIVSEVELDIERVEQIWGRNRGQRNLSKVLTYVLKESHQPIMLIIDDVDRLLKTDFHTDFFALLRSWYNRRGFYPDTPWSRLNLVLSISTEPHLLIDNLNQSPFNVGQTLNLKDFNESQVRDLNQRHGLPMKEGEIEQMMMLLNGHPYLTRQAFYTMVTESLDWPELIDIATTDQGPFAAHLRRYHVLLHDKPYLKAALKQIIRQKRCPDQMMFYRLLQAGLIIGDSKSCRCRCKLYHIYFEGKL